MQWILRLRLLIHSHIVKTLSKSEIPQMPGYLLPMKNIFPQAERLAKLNRVDAASSTPYQPQAAQKIAPEKQVPSCNANTNPRVVQLMSISAETIESTGFGDSDASMVARPSKTGGEALRF